MQDTHNKHCSGSINSAGQKKKSKTQIPKPKEEMMVWVQ